MAKRRVKKELDAPEAFEQGLHDELSVSAEFDLPLSVLALRAEVAFEFETVHRALEALRVADLICQPDPTELIVALPNTRAEDALVVEEMLRKAAPGAAFGVAVRAWGDTAETLLKRARGTATAPELPSPYHQASWPERFAAMPAKKARKASKVPAARTIIRTRS